MQSNLLYPFLLGFGLYALVLRLMLHRQKIAITHVMLEREVHMVKDGFVDDYDIIIHEMSEVVKVVTSKSKN